MSRHSLLIVMGVAVVSGCILAFLPSPLNVVEDQATALKYAVRGNLLPDSSIILTYVDENAVRAIGWPIRRNFYALLLKTLGDLHVRAVGLEVMFEDSNIEYPEYDELLAAMVHTLGTVVLPVYFDGIDERQVPSSNSMLSQFAFPAVGGRIPSATMIHTPIPSLMSRSAGVGHVNFVRESDVPVFLAADVGHVPSFAMELLRVAFQADRSAVIMESARVRVLGRHGQIAFDVEPDGTVALNLPGRISAFPAYPFMEVLRSYDALRAGRAPKIPLLSFRDKIVLVGVIAEGRSQFFNTPVDPRFPSIGIHAAFVDNAMHNRFLISVPLWVTALVGVLFGLGMGCIILLVNVPHRWLIIGGAVSLLVIASQLLFSHWSWNLPVSPLLLTGLVTGIAAQMVRQRETRYRVSVLEEDKERVLAQLHDRETKLEILERELVNVREAKSADRTAELLEEIRKYKAEVQTLSSRADDLEEYHEDLNGRSSHDGIFDDILYDPNGPMKSVIEFIKKIAVSDAPVLIFGESGTGKELVAKAIHNHGNRSSGPFVAVNCGALTESLLESELFGHDKGAFTGAVKDRLGRFEIAHGGTIFLDEIGEVSEEFQVKLLRVLQEGELERVGGSKTIKVNVRVLAATHRDLKHQVAVRKFRDDLYYRLNVLAVTLPPLRERPTDIPLLVRYFLRKEGEGHTISRNVMEAFLRFPWPGNVRELESVVKRASLLATAERRTMITVKDLTEEIASAARQAVSVEDQILDTLREKGFSRSSISETAEELGGLSRGTVAEYLRGECLKKFVETNFDRKETARQIALSADRAAVDRAAKKLEEYLQNLTEAVDRSQPWETTRTALRPKTKNLPQRYHPYLEAVAEAYSKGLWTIGGK
jgi:transcriptional regulator with GAF, ATPase, and Fis domain